MPTLHILSCPYSPVHVNNRIDPFSIAVYKFIKHMTALEWNCIHYDIEGSCSPCETVRCLETIHENNDHNIREYNANAAIEISKRKKPDDIILCFYGDENKIAAEYNNDLKIVEPHIGYSAQAVFAPYRVFCSYAQMHYYYGRMNMLLNPSWFDAVIYNAITESEFEYEEIKDDYFLFFGRIIEEKGIHIAIQATEAAGKKLILAGPGSLTNLGYQSIPKHVELVGLCNVEQRKLLMKQAKAIIAPTYYLEPFGNMIAEGYMSGTPAITSDWGGFNENVVNGTTGFRCREFKEFVHAINNIDSIDNKNCKIWAMNNCEDSIVHLKYNQYLEKLQHLNFYR